jgi:hypothetical protein
MDALLTTVPAQTAPPEYLAARGKSRGRVGVLTGCVQRYLFDDVTRSTIRLL